MKDCRAAIFDPGKSSIEVRPYPLTELAEGEIRVRVTSCTICGSDLHTFTGRRKGNPHSILGHEIIGTVDEWAGERPTDYFGHPLELGQRITWTLCVCCGHCDFCQRGLTQKCRSLFKYGHETLSTHPQGGFSTHCVLAPGTQIFPVPNELPDRVACPANCATATVAAAIRLLKEVHEIRNASIFISGLGMLGLTAAAWCAEQGARQIIASDINPRRRALAQKFGATDVVDPTESPQLIATIDRLTNGQMIDAALEFSGVPVAVSDSLATLRIGGTLILGGSVFPTDPIPVHPEQIVRRLLTIRGIHNYHADDLNDAIQFLTRNQDRFPFGELVSQQYPLEEIEQALHEAMENAPVRIAICPT